MVLPPKKPDLLPGIYFGLQSKRYHEDRALSRSNLVDLLDTPFTFWANSWMNPDRKERPKSKDMIRGSAFDCMLFEPDQFSKRFQIVPIDPWVEGKMKIELVQFQGIVEAIKVLRKGEDSAKFLSNGIPHVTIVFDWQGFRFRCEHDYFMIHSSTDFKSVFSLANWHIKDSCRKYGLDIQMALYKRSRMEFKKAYAEGKAGVFGNVDPVFFKKFISSPRDEFMFVFQRESAPYPYRPLFMKDDTEDSGLDKIDKAVSIYTANLKEHGTNPWPVCTGKIEEFSMFFS